MGIKEVSYERLFSFGQYENEKIRMSATIDDGQTPEIVLGNLVTKISGIEDILQTYRELVKRVESSEYHLRQTNESVNQTETRIADMKVKIEEISAKLQRGELDVDDKLRHACDRQSYKDLKDQLTAEQNRLKEREKEFQDDCEQRDILKKRILAGNFDVEGVTIISPRRNEFY